MRQQRYELVPGRLFSRATLFLMLAGVALNVGFNKLMSLLGAPLYLDNIGSILAAALGGPLPGMALARARYFSPV